MLIFDAFRSAHCLASPSSFESLTGEKTVFQLFLQMKPAIHRKHLYFVTLSTIQNYTFYFFSIIFNMVWVYFKKFTLSGHLRLYAICISSWKIKYFICLHYAAFFEKIMFILSRHQHKACVRPNASKLFSNLYITCETKKKMKWGLWGVTSLLPTSTTKRL